MVYFLQAGHRLSMYMVTWTLPGSASRETMLGVALRLLGAFSDRCARATALAAFLALRC